jgi:c-di-GMP-related signal transduction protein
VHPDDRKQSEHAPRQMLADGITDRKVLRFRSRLNQWRWLDVSGSLLKRAEEPVDNILLLDDFGSGFSSLRYLRSLPVDIVKIDGSFVKNIRSDQIDLTLLRSMNEIAHLLGKRTVGEFVDSGEMSRSLKELGVDYGQGYYFGAPVPINKTN